MTSASIVVCGLPGSGKTTFLAALWYVVQSGEIDARLKLASLDFSQYDYVNEIRDRWLEGRRQQRTVGDARTIGIDLKNSDGEIVTLLFPDHSGETFDAMWATRSCTEQVATQLRARSGVLLFLRPFPKEPVPLTEIMATEAAMANAIGERSSDYGDPPLPQDWTPEISPDQVKIVDTLQTLTQKLDIGRREKMAIFISAWDLADEGLTPESFIERRMPLLHQFLEAGNHNFEFRVYGISAQGSDYVEDGFQGELPENLEMLLALDKPSARIKIVHGVCETHDITGPIAWLMT